MSLSAEFCSRAQAEAKKLAFYLYHNIRAPHAAGASHKHHIVLDDLQVDL